MGQSSCGTSTTFPRQALIPDQREHGHIAGSAAAVQLLTLGQDVASMAAQSNATAAKRGPGLHFAMPTPVENAANNTSPGQTGKGVSRSRGLHGKDCRRHRHGKNRERDQQAGFAPSLYEIDGAGNGQNPRNGRLNKTKPPVSPTVAPAPHAPCRNSARYAMKR